MPVPQIGLLEAFAIGIPVGIAGFAVQEVIGRQRHSRGAAPREKPMQTQFGPREKPQIDAEEILQPVVDVTPSPPAPVTKPSRTRPKRVGTTPPKVAVATSPAKVLAGATRKAASVPVEAAPVAAAAVAVPSAAAAKAAPAKAARAKSAAPKPAAAPKAAAPPVPEAAPAAGGQPATVKGPPKPLLKRQASLDTALDAVVDFVDGQPRKARAEACATALAGLVSKSTRGPALLAFLAATASGTAPGELQALAEAVGVELAGQLQAVRREISAFN